MNAQSFARMRNQQSVHKRAKDARWRSHKVVMQGCIKTATQSRYARMHKDSHTEPLHDATAQMAVDAQMWQPKRLTRHDAKPTEQARRARMHDSGRTKSAQGRADPNDRNSTPRYIFARSTSGVLFFGAAGGRTRNLRVRHGCLIK
jgi:hypothetical protein